MGRSPGSGAAAYELDGGQVRRRRSELGWTQSRLADEAACSRGYVSMIERGGLALSYQTARGVAEALGRSVGELSAGTPSLIPLRVAAAPALAPGSPPTRSVYLIVTANDRLGLVHDFVDLLAHVGQNVAMLVATRTRSLAEITCSLDGVQVDPLKLHALADLFASTEGGELRFFGEGAPATVMGLNLPVPPAVSGDPSRRDQAGLPPGPARAGRRVRRIQVVMADHRGLVRDVTRELKSEGVDINWIRCKPDPDNLDYVVQLETVEVSGSTARLVVDRLRKMRGEPRVLELDDIRPGAREADPRAHAAVVAGAVGGAAAASGPRR